MSVQRLNKDRYRLHGDWHLAGSAVCPTGTVKVHACDLLERRSGHVWRLGAYKVIGYGTPEGAPRNTTFYGETAWMDAQRLANDIASHFGDWRHPINL